MYIIKYMNYCVKCGDRLTAGVIFCTNCGIKISQNNKLVKKSQRKYKIYEVFMFITAILFALAAAANVPGGYTAGSEKTYDYIANTFTYLIPTSLIVFVPAVVVGKYLLVKKKPWVYLLNIFITASLIFFGFLFLAYGVL